MRHEGDLVITQTNAQQYVGLVSVSGRLWVSADFEAPRLESVGGDLAVDGDFEAPKLKKVAGDLVVVNALFKAPNLESVSGGLEVYTPFKAPQLKSVGGWLYVGVPFDHSKITFGAGRILAVSGYALHERDGLYWAGCRGPWTKEEALNHWGRRTDERAVLFTAAIMAQP